MNGLVETPFKLTLEEILTSAAATLCLSKLTKAGIPERTLDEICFQPQYGYTASASTEPCGPRLVRITDIKGGTIDWHSVPFCDCSNSSGYELTSGDILVARSGSVGKSFMLTTVPEIAVFASYMIRLRTKEGNIPSYVYWCLQSQQFWQQIMGARRGSAMKNINGKMLASLRFPYPLQTIQNAIVTLLETFRERLRGGDKVLPALPPPIEEQRSLVARIEELAAKIAEARGLRSQAVKETEGLYTSALASAMQPHSDSWQRQTVADVILSMDAGWSPQCEDRPTSNYEWGVLKTTSVQWGEFRPRENKVLPKSLVPIPELCVQVGDVLVTRAGPRKRVAVVAAVQEAQPRLMISDKLIRLRLDQSKVEPRFLEMSLASPFSQEHLVQRKTGLADAQVNISQAILRATPLAYPPLPEQRRIVAYLDNLQSKVDALKQMQAKTAAELNALLPSILDKAFKGEL